MRCQIKNIPVSFPIQTFGNRGNNFPLKDKCYEFVKDVTEYCYLVDESGFYIYYETNEPGTSVNPDNLIKVTCSLPDYTLDNLCYIALQEDGETMLFLAETDEEIFLSCAPADAINYLALQEDGITAITLYNKDQIIF